MNLNDLAKEICKREGKKVQVNIAQVKEILRITNELQKNDWRVVDMSHFCFAHIRATGNNLQIHASNDRKNWITLYPESKKKIKKRSKKKPKAKKKRALEAKKKALSQKKKL